MDIEEAAQSTASEEEPVLVTALDDEPQGTTPAPDPDPSGATTDDNVDWGTAQEADSDTSTYSNLITKLEAIEQSQASLAKDIEGLQHAFDSKIKYDSGKEKTIDSLHAELQTYRDDLVLKILRPVLLDLIEMYNDLGSVLGRAGNDGSQEDQAKHLWETLSTFQSTIVEVLARNGVEAFSEPEALFVPRTQRSVRILDTDDPAKDRMIADRLRQGFVYGDRLIAHEQVTVYRYQPGSTTENNTGEA